jgi:hypothetical protein
LFREKMMCVYVGRKQKEKPEKEKAIIVDEKIRTITNKFNTRKK